MPEESKESKKQDENVIIFKGRFKSNLLKLYGLFIIIFDKEGEIENSNIIVSTYSTIYDLEPHTNWSKYEETIMDQKWRGNFNNSMTSSLADQLDTLNREEVLKNQLYDYLTLMNHDNVDSFIFDIINRIIHDKNLILETDIQIISPEDYQRLKEERYKDEEAESGDKKDDFTVEEGSVILIVEPILSPVKGKPLYELKIGDKIMTKIVPNTERANYFIDLLDLRIENHIKPIPCEIVDIKAESKNDPVEILTQIGPGIYGRCIEDERQVKLRMYDPSRDGQISKTDISKQRLMNAERDSKAAETGLSKNTYMLIALFVGILIIIMIIIYISL